MSQSKQSCFLCGIFILSNVLVQSIENLLELVYPDDNDMKSSSFIILCFSLYRLKLRLVKITPKPFITKLLLGARNQTQKIPALP